MDANEYGNGIAAWYGGPMTDHEADPTAQNYANSLFRFDGSGYLAGGLLKWGVSNGEAFLNLNGEAVVGGMGGATLNDIANLMFEVVQYETGHYAAKVKASAYYNGSLVPLDGLYTDGFMAAGGIGTTGGGGSASYLNDLLDVTTTGATNGQALVYNNGIWSPGDGGTIVASLPDLTDVNDNLYTGLQTGQALVWDGTKWTGGTVSGNVDPATVSTYGTVKVAAVEGGTATVYTTVYGNRHGVKMDGSGKTYVDINLTATTSYFGGFKLLVAQRSGSAAVSDSMITTGGDASGKYYGVEMNAAGHLYVNVPWTGGGGTAGVSSWAGLSGTILLSQAVDALDESFLKLSGGTLTGMLTVTPADGNNAGIEISTNSNSFYGNQALKFVNDSQTQRIRGYIEGTTNGWIGIYARSGLWLSPGYSHNNGMTLDTTGLYPVTAGTLVIDSTTGTKSSDGNGRDLGTSSAPFRALHSKVIYLDSGAYIYYDTVNGCIRTNAPIVSDSYISAGGVQST